MSALRSGNIILFYSHMLVKQINTGFVLNLAEPKKFHMGQDLHILV